MPNRIKTAVSCEKLFLQALQKGVVKYRDVLWLCKVCIIMAKCVCVCGGGGGVAKFLVIIVWLAKF